MEEIQASWDKISLCKKNEIKQLLFTDYDFSKKNIDRDIAKNIKRVYSVLKEKEN